MDDLEHCIYATGIEDRVINNAVPLVTSTMDFFKVLMIDDTCYSTAA